MLSSRIQVYEAKGRRTSHLRPLHRGGATSTGYVIGPNSESIIHFTYQVSDSTYEGTEPGDLVNGRTRFLVRFSTKNPANYEGYKRVFIPYYVPAPPPEGWAKLPPQLDVPAGVLD